jgi:hypothetical protein
MRDFVNATFGSVELDAAPEYEIAAATVVTLFREGNRTLPELQAAISAHRWLSRDAVEMVKVSVNSANKAS